ncbi:helix-turn-helix domain-containing protein [Enterocloster aldenensis]|uniref:LexA family protein n=1 Tax=Enterocloster aldenensis TaxID=358742 RepID=UPI004026AEB0
MKLTEKESQIYQYILAYTQEHMYTPTIREIGKAVGYKSTSTVASYLERLESKGMIEVGQDSPRAIRLVGYSIVPHSMIEELNKLRVVTKGI